MAIYQYSGKIVSTNTNTRGEIEASNTDAARQRLQSQGVEVKSLKVKPDGFAFKLPGTSGISPRELIIFSRQLSTMIDSGLPIVQCLDLLASQEANANFKKVQLAIKADLETGMTFADALTKHPLVFSNLYVSLVRAGELGGVLDTILVRICVQLEKTAAMKKKIKSALMMPMGTLVAGIVISIFMLWKIIPTFQEMFDNMGGQLPGLTQMLVDLSNWVSSNIVYILLVVIGVPVLISFALKQRPIKKAWDTIAIQIPGVGDVIKKSAVASFTRTLGSMLSSGVPLLDGLQIVSESVTNIAVEEALQFTRQRLQEGSTLADPLSVCGVFPNMVVQMIRVGEETGALDTMLNKIADFYDEEVDDAIAKLMAAIQPVAMCFLAVMVGGMLIGMYLPIFSMSSNIKT